MTTITPSSTPEYIINKNNATVLIIRNWLSSTESSNLHQRLVTNVQWISGQMNFGGKLVDIPRKLFFLGDANVKQYSYSRLTFPVQDWFQNELYKQVEDIRTKIMEDKLIQEATKTNLSFDSCLLNYYRDGMDKIDHHSDKEALGILNAVVTVSLGASRTIVFKSKEKIGTRYSKVETNLNNGDLLLMFGDCQKLWTHGIPRDNSKDSRISLTYRLIKK